MKKILILYILLSFSACKKEAINKPQEYNKLLGIWKGLHQHRIYSLHFDSNTIKRGNSDYEEKSTLIDAQFSVINNEFTFNTSIKYPPRLKKYKGVLVIKTNNTFDTIIYRNVKYVKL